MTPYLRPATQSDVSHVGAILSGFVDTTDWMPRIHTRAEDIAFAAQMVERGWVTVAQTRDRIAGFLARDRAMVHALYHRAGLCGQGLGKALLDHAKAAQDRLELWTFQANRAAHRFYLREGFVEIARTNGAGNDEGLPDIRLLWERKT